MLTLIQVWSFSPPSENLDSRAATPISLPDREEAAEQEDSMDMEERWQRLAVEQEEDRPGEEQPSKTTTEEDTTCDVAMQD